VGYLDYPNIRACQLPAGRLTATPRRTLTLGLFMIHAIRQFERWLLDHAELVHGPLHSSIGQEAVAAGTALALEPMDKITSTHRAHHDVLAKLIAHAAPADFDPTTAAEVPAPVGRGPDLARDPRLDQAVRRARRIDAPR
jgi:hypothetical protein